MELAKYLKYTEDKLHHKWFTTVLARAVKVMKVPILKKTSKGQFVTTLQDALQTIWDETRLFLQTRFQVPHVCHVLLMQKPDLVHHNRAIIAILERLASIVERLTPFEFVVLNSNYAAVENALNLGLSHVTWPSLCLATYIQELLESVERFQAVAEDVVLISKVLDDRIALIMDHRLLDDSSAQHSTAAQFFDSLSQKGDEFFIDIRRVVSDLPPVLLQVESLVSNSQTGCSAEMQNYYDHWRERIYRTVLTSLQDRFTELSTLLERGPAQFAIQVSLSGDAAVVVEPNLESIEREISGIVHHWIKRSAVVPNWQEGTCIPLPAAGQRSFYDRLSQEPLLRVTVERNQKHCKRLVDKLRQVIDKWTACSELWTADKSAACQELHRASPALWQYDEQLQHYRNYWTERIGAIEDEAVICCVSLQMQPLKRSAQEHVNEWIRKLGATWLDGTRDKLSQLEGLLDEADGGNNEDGTIDIDVEMLLAEVGESWHRLGHYDIKVIQFSSIKRRLKFNW